jgi:hypothetical protein
MLSAWIAEKGLHCVVNVGKWHAEGRNEAAAWGILLADVIRHLGNAMCEECGVEASATVTEVTQSLLAELESPTSPVRGSFHVGHS